MHEPSTMTRHNDSIAPASPRRELSGGLKMLTEAGPLLLFFVVNAKWGIFAATAAYMVSAVLAMGYTWLKIRRLPLMPIIALVFVLAFGGLTIWLHDDVFIKLKVTLVNLLFAAILLGGLAFNRLFLKMLMGEAFRMDDAGWRKLTIAWGVFFLAVAGLNEVVWRNVSTDAWVNFKVFGLLPLTFAFAIAMAPMMMKHQLPDEQGEDAGEGGESR